MQLKNVVKSEPAVYVQPRTNNISRARKGVVSVKEPKTEENLCVTNREDQRWRWVRVKSSGSDPFSLALTSVSHHSKDGEREVRGGSERICYCEHLLLWRTLRCKTSERAVGWQRFQAGSWFRINTRQRSGSGLNVCVLVFSWVSLTIVSRPTGAEKTYSSWKTTAKAWWLIILSCRLLRRPNTWGWDDPAELRRRKTHRGWGSDEQQERSQHMKMMSFIYPFKQFYWSLNWEENRRVGFMNRCLADSGLLCERWNRTLSIRHSQFAYTTGGSILWSASMSRGGAECLFFFFSFFSLCVLSGGRSRRALQTSSPCCRKHQAEHKQDSLVSSEWLQQPKKKEERKTS